MSQKPWTGVVRWMLILGQCAAIVIAEPDYLNMSKCTNILGMESGKIPDSDITATSSFHSSNLGPHRARLKHDNKGGAWCPKRMMNQSVTEYLEINLRTTHSITAVQTQGRFASGQGREYTEQYWLEYWRPGFKTWIVWRNRTGHKLLQGNNNTIDILENKLEPFLLAEKLRIFPFSMYARTVCMRIELIGCIWTLGLVSYSMQQGVMRGADVNLTDRTYDGFIENGRLFGGLGQLTDGQKGDDSFREDPNGYGKGYEWVGWRNDTIGLSSHVEILFEFSQVRNFTSMLIYTNNMFSKDVQVFSHVKVFFSIGGVHFNGEPVDFAYMPDNVLQVARYVTVKLHNRVGKFLRLHLYFASKWIMISEVNFDSKLAIGNFSEEGYEVTLKQQVAGHSTQSTKSWTDPFMRDEVPTTHKGILGDEGERLPKKDVGSVRQSHGDQETFGSTSEYLVVGILSSVAAILLGAIIFVSIRSRGGRPPLGQTPHNILPGPIMRGINGLKLDDDKEEVTYHEPYQVRTYYQPPTPQRPDRQYGTDLAQVTVHQYLATNRRVDEEQPERPPPPPFLLPLPDLGLPELNLPVHIYDSLVFPSRLSIGPEQFYECINSPDPAPPSVPLITAQTIKKLEGDLKYFEDERTAVVDLVAFPWKSLRVLHPLGEGQFGTVFMCEVIGKPQRSQVVKGDLVAVQTLRMDCTPAAGRNFDQHIMRLGRLKHTNVGKVLGCCREDDKPYGLVLEHLYAGDLNEFLQNRAPDANLNSPQSGMTLGIGCLIYMAAQIASGMKYLEAVNFVHKDLATRNCLVGNSYLVKVGNIGVGKLRYPQDYYVVERRSGPPSPMPIRWMSWESVLMDKFTSKSDSWAFGVTLWEMLTYGRVQPYQELSNMMVMENLKQLCHSSAEQGTLQIMLSNPINCPRDVYELMSDCWKKSESARPNFREIYEFLQAKNIGFRSNIN